MSLQFIDTLNKVLALEKAIVAAIKSVEAAVPISGAGAAKLNAVIAIVQLADSTITASEPILVGFINTIFVLLKGTGQLTPAAQ
jgi:hypothetical protein